MEGQNKDFHEVWCTDSDLIDGVKKKLVVADIVSDGQRSYSTLCAFDINVSPTTLHNHQVALLLKLKQEVTTRSIRAQDESIGYLR